ncbi:uncharacterized protein LOC105166158 [Sesamum indicum]|uniref:Uncharacterized protein LOC105166158 n=1 Tax=Sesamum indicum TaxID=4182 RepID=A0A6I9TR80_SESIN|nr:uncharacterized protein LOC105166158 [Sesamum indicum]
MELRRCETRHFIQTVRDGLVKKVSNISSHGRPVIQFKTLKDVYENEDIKRLQGSPSNLVFNYEQLKRENSCFPVADRILQEVKHETDEFVPRADDDVDSDVDDDTTLKQLKVRLLKKKRKSIHSDEDTKQDNVNEKPVEDEPDLYEPLINWKLKPLKASKAKRKHMNLDVVSSSIINFSIKSEEHLMSEGSSQVGRELAPVICVKVEVPDAEQLGCLDKTSSADDSSIAHDEGLNPVGILSNGFQQTALLEYGEPQLSGGKYENCVTNETLFDHLEDVEPISVLVPWDGTRVKLATPESICEEFLDSPPLPTEKRKETRDAHSCISSPPEDPESDVFSHSGSSSSIEELSEQRSSSGVRAPDMATNGIGCSVLHQELNCILFEDKSNADFTYKQDDSMNSPGKDCGSQVNSMISLRTDESLLSVEDAKADEEQSSTCSSNAIKKNDLHCEGPVEDELLKAEEKQKPASPVSGTESQSSLMSRACDSKGGNSKPEPCQPPDRLLSTRKVISPSSQEQLHLVMKSFQLCDYADQDVSDCKRKLFGKQTGKKASPVRSDIQSDKVNVNHHRQSGQVSQQKVISPRHIMKKSHIAKGNLEGPRFSRTLPNLSTGCTSIQGCSESAIAFSQRQMHDMESLAVKLIDELKSMKDIVEQKLLFEAYRNVSLKNNADEVKSAINNAKKVEEMARKWISVMARDCNRFCKIMKMTPNNTTGSKDAVPRSRKKIIFADEAGGKLCHVKFFENNETSPIFDDVKQ